MTSLRSMASLTGGLGGRNSISTNTVSPLIVKLSDLRYGYNYLREIILRRADYQDYKISEKDFKNLHPNDFEDMFLLNIQEKLNHLPKTDKTSLHTTVNMWIRNLVIRNRVGNDLFIVTTMSSRCSVDQPVVNISYSSSNKAFQTS
ncbi:hypothetical protein Tco_0220146, partial [Tanacetum coccineum]